MTSNQTRSRKTNYIVISFVVVIILITATFATATLLSHSNKVSIEATNYSTTSSSTTLSSTSTLYSISSSSTSSSFIFSTSSTTTSSTTTSVSTVDDWLTYHYSANRSGYFTFIPNVNSPSVNWTAKVDAAVYAEPLYYNGYVFIATENNSVYALSATTGAIVWSTHLGTPADSLAPPYACNGDGPDITPIIGITGTPVIDPTTGTIYVAALIRNTGYVLFALNVHTGQEQWNASITASGFDYMPEEERGALALSNGLVYVPFGGYSYDCVQPGPIGWVFAMSTSGGGVVSAYEVPSGNEADVWTPEGVTVDSSGFVYIVTGNSYYNATYNYGDSVIKLTSNLTVVSYFAPSNWAYLGPADLDQDTTGATLLPDNLIFSIGKSGVGYLLNSSDLGGIGGQLYSAQVCGSVAAGWPYGAWGSTSYANSIIYVPCGTGLNALKLEPGANPMFISLWNYTGIWAGPPIIAGDAVWTVDINSGNFYALNPQTGSVLFQMSAGPVEHFTTPSAGGGLVFLAANQTIYAINPSSSSSAGGADDLIFNALTLSSIAPLSVYCAGVFEVDSSSNFARRLDFLGSPTMNI